MFISSLSISSCDSPFAIWNSPSYLSYPGKKKTRSHLRGIQVRLPGLFPWGVEGMLQPAVRSGPLWLAGVQQKAIRLPEARAPQRWDGAIPGGMLLKWWWNALKLDVPNYGRFSTQASSQYIQYIQYIRSNQLVLCSSGPSWSATLCSCNACPVHVAPIFHCAMWQYIQGIHWIHRKVRPAREPGTKRSISKLNILNFRTFQNPQFWLFKPWRDRSLPEGLKRDREPSWKTFLMATDSPVSTTWQTQPRRCLWEMKSI